MDKVPVILIVDDDPDDLSFLHEALLEQQPASEIIEAYDGLAALAILSEMEENLHQPDLIVMDINMPMMDGRELLKQVRNSSFTSNTPAVVYTTSSNYFDQLHCDAYNAQLILKPESLDQLKKVAEQILRISIKKAA